MKEITQQAIQADIKALSRDRIGPDDPESMRNMILKMGGTQEEADQAASFIEQQNRLWDEAQRKAS
jgi:hypothetical protein